MRLVEVTGIHLEASTGAPIVVLREHDAPHRLLPIFVGGSEAVAIGLALSGQSPPRPLTHDVMAALVESLDADVERVEVTELRDGSFLAELAVRGPAGERRLDTRPSDAIALALRLHAPVFVSDAVLDEAGSTLSEAADIDAIDRQVDEFRFFLDDLDSAAIGSDGVSLPPVSPPDPPVATQDDEGPTGGVGDEPDSQRRDFGAG